MGSRNPGKAEKGRKSRKYLPVREYKSKLWQIKGGYHGNICRSKPPELWKGRERKKIKEISAKVPTQKDQMADNRAEFAKYLPQLATGALEKQRKEENQRNICQTASRKG